MPAGRPPVEKSFTNMLRIAVAETYDEVEGVKRTKLRALADALVMKGIAGDVQAQNAIADRLEGKPMQSIETTVVNSHEDMLDQLDGKDSGESRVTH